MTEIHVYRVEHDRGLAPNPFFGTLTLAVCKGRIRQTATIGSIVVGTVSYGRKQPAGRPNGGNVVFAMRVTGAIDFEAYRRSFPRERPTMNGSRLRMVGDAIYHQDDGRWIQDNSLHAEPGGDRCELNVKRDVLDADRVLLSTDFTYWGDLAPSLPAELAHLGGRHVRYKRHLSAAEVGHVEGWIVPQLGQGRLGMPIDWQL